MFRSTGEGMDGRAIVEVETSSCEMGMLTLAGTACAYEANLIFEISSDQEHLQTFFANVSAAAPERGTWTFRVKAPQVPVSIRLGDEDVRSGGLYPPSVVHLRVQTDGSISEATHR